ncbi:MAG: hypothetical protein JWM51_1712 [Microbacteriaceae bacterium]|jgi:hypothetical protein|nr:hypothetical protein [Microbacteriaceae bacterium]
MIHRATETINFRDVGSDFRWIDIKTFDVPKLAPRKVLLDCVITHAWYDDDYASPSGALPEPSRGIHGPYALDKIRVSDFTEVSRSRCFEEITAWANQLGPLPADFVDRYQGRLSSLLAGATAIYRLADLGSDAEHKWGGHLGTMGFIEFIVVSATSSSLAILVASDD